MEQTTGVLAILLNKILRLFDSHICECRAHRVLYRWQQRSTTADTKQ